MRALMDAHSAACGKRRIDTTCFEVFATVLKGLGFSRATGAW